MYIFLRGLHNLVRWLVVFGGVWALLSTLQGLFSRSAWNRTHQRAGVLFTSSLHLQLLLGIVLYVISPLIASGLRDIGAAMQSQRIRFFLVEHLLLMLLAIVAAQLGFSLARRAGSDREKFVRALIGYSLAALLLAFGIPWWRSLIPWA